MSMGREESSIVWVRMNKMLNHHTKIMFMELCDLSPGGPLVFEVGYHPPKKIHVIRVVFQDQTMYMRTSFRGAKTCKIGESGVFLVMFTHFGKDMTEELRKKHAKCIFRVFFHT